MAVKEEKRRATTFRTSKGTIEVRNVVGRIGVWDTVVPAGWTVQVVPVPEPYFSGREPIYARGRPSTLYSLCLKVSQDVDVCIYLYRWKNAAHTSKMNIYEEYVNECLSVSVQRSPSYLPRAVQSWNTATYKDFMVEWNFGEGIICPHGYQILVQNLTASDITVRRLILWKALLEEDTKEVTW